MLTCALCAVVQVEGACSELAAAAAEPEDIEAGASPFSSIRPVRAPSCSAPSVSQSMIKNDSQGVLVPPGNILALTPSSAELATASAQLDDTIPNPLAPLMNVPQAATNLAVAAPLPPSAALRTAAAGPSPTDVADRAAAFLRRTAPRFTSAVSWAAPTATHEDISLPGSSAEGTGVPTPISSPAAVAAAHNEQLPTPLAIRPVARLATVATTPDEQQEPRVSSSLTTSPRASDVQRAATARDAGATVTSVAEAWMRTGGGADEDVPVSSEAGVEVERGDDNEIRRSTEGILRQDVPSGSAGAGLAMTMEGGLDASNDVLPVTGTNNFGAGNEDTNPDEGGENANPNEGGARHEVDAGETEACQVCFPLAVNH